MTIYHNSNLHYPKIEHAHQSLLSVSCLLGRIGEYVLKVPQPRHV